MPEPTYPLAPRDKLLDIIAKDVSRTQPRVPFFRSLTEPSALSPLSPLPHGFVLSEDDEEGTTIPQRIESAAALFERLQMIEKALRPPMPSRKSSLAPSEGSLEAPTTPQIRLSPSIEEEEEEEEEENPPDAEGSKKAKQEAPESSGPPSVSVTSPTSPTGFELLPSHAIPKPTPKHSQILLRILYLFSVTHPHQPYTQGLNELLAPLYLALCMDLDEKEAVHAEADAFWLFSEMIGEVGAVVGEPGDWRSPSPGEAALPVPGGSGAAQNGVKGAMAELSARLKWADLQLWEDLVRKSLDPKLPYYSYRWIACLLAQDLPIGTVLHVWDTIFAQPPSTPDSNPRISFLLNICISMLIRLRFRLVKTGNAAVQSGGLWDDEYVDADQVIKAKTGVPPTEAEGGVMGEGFVEGMQLLQSYPVQAVGIDMIIAGAWELDAKWKREEELRARGPSVVTSVGNRLTKAIWNGITNTSAMEDDEPSEDEDEGQATEKESNRPPSIQKIEQDAAKETPTIAPQGGGALPAAARWRNAVESFRDSDAAAALSKNATNWRVAAMDAWQGKSSAASGAPSSVRSPPPSEKHLPDTPTSPPPTGPAASKLRQYADAFKSSDTAAQLSKTSTNWTAAAMERWNSRPAHPSPLNPAPPPAETGPEGTRSRGGSLGSWSAWGAKAGSLWGGGKDNAPSPTQMDTLSPTWVPSQQADNRTSLPVPLRGRDPPSPQSHSRERSRSGDDRSTSPGLRPPKFAHPRDSLTGWNEAAGSRDPIEEALAKARAERAAAEPRESSPEEGSTSSRIGKSLQSALASLSGSSRPPSPPPPAPVPPRQLMLGTAAAKTFASPTSRTGPGSSPRRPSADSRPSSVSSNASSVLPSSGRSVTPTANRTSQSTIATSVQPDSPAGTVPSDSERKSSRDSISERPGFVPLRNGVGRQTGSAAIMRKSRAAHARGRADAGMENDSPLHASPVSHERSPSTPLSMAPELPKDIKKYVLTDGPVAKPAEPQRYSLTDAPVQKPVLKISPRPSPAASPASAPAPDSPVRAHADGYSSAGSTAGVPVLRPGIRKKRMYVPKNPALRVMTSQQQQQQQQHPEPDELGMVSHTREGSVDEYGGLRLPYMSDGLTTPQPLTPSASQLDALKTPTSADVEIRPRSPLRSPRRGKKIPSRPNSKVMSEEDGARADDEDGYEDLLSAYSEDDGGHPRSYAI
ncbi:hypothetical protein FRC01_005281 [Tulasnella sp. 417]|nr:hypothetical protein FRC01_005281 [Tulasnella sp. 417]